MKLETCLKLMQSYIGFMCDPKLFREKYPNFTKAENQDDDPFAYYPNHSLCIKRPQHAIPISLEDMIDASTSKEPQNQFLKIIVNQQDYPYKFSIEDILANDWEFVVFPIFDHKDVMNKDNIDIKTFDEIFDKFIEDFKK